MLNEAPTISTASRISDEPRPATPPAPPKPKPRLKRLRFLAILFAGLLLGIVSFVFGMFIAVASDLPSLTKFALLKDARSSVVLDDLGHPIGIVSQQNRVIVTPTEIPPIVKDAVISIEDKRFLSNSGIDIRGIGRAFIQDTLHKGSGVQGASTIEQQFIKNALQAQSHRTIFEKLREAALAYQLSHKWSKDKIITAYLNTIYFGNGAYGIESAAETYFGADVNHVGCGLPGHPLCVQQLQPWEAALLAGIIRSPTAYDPANHPIAARERRNLVLREMLNQGYISRSVYEESVNQALPASKDVQTPREQKIEGVDVGYFTSWVRQQVIERYGAPRAFDGGLRITTTLDLELQRSAEQAVNAYLGGSGPTASLVAIENSTGEVRAMVGGRSYDESPFNLATSGERQPGSAFKAFDLAAALESGISPESVWSSKAKTFYVPSSHGTEKFVVHNDENAYAGSNTLTGATAYSDNSVYAEVGLKVGTHRIALLAHRMGITTPLSTNPAMTIGGLTVGVTALDMAHAYETIAHGGRRVSGTLAEAEAPVGIQEVDAGSASLPDGHHRDKNQVVTRAVLPPAVASTETSMLETVLQYGTAKAGALGQFAAGKTGTTSNFGDAWFIGWDSKYTVAVWVGYPNSLVPMTTEFNGKPVMGGTFPTLIWHDFMTAALQIDKTRAENGAAAHSGNGGQPGASGGESSAPSSSGSTPQPSSPSGGGKGGSPGGGGAAKESGGGSATSEHAPAPSSPPANTPATPPSSAPPPAPSAPAAPSQPPSGGTSPTGGVGPSG
ncbi:MAG TPA: transglycosylase domain-containing protein [Solirubrobacteraceae bacterium]